MKTLPSLLTAGLALAAFAAPARLQQADIVDTLLARNAKGAAGATMPMAKSQFTILVQLVQKAGLASTLKGAGPFTLLAPTDAAFAKIPSEIVKKISDDPAMLKEVLTYHVIPGKIMAADLKTMKTDTVAGPKISVKVGGKKGPRFGKAGVVEADIQASNGVIHAIDTVLLPPKVMRSLGMAPVKKKKKGGGITVPAVKSGGGAAGPNGGF